MGTSVNQRSPDTDNWRVVQDIYIDPDLSAADSLKVLWRAASNPNEPNLYGLLSRPEIAGLADLLDRHYGPAEAASATRAELASTKVSSLATDIAARAIIQCTGKEEAKSLYVQQLFAEATSYLVARDLPGYVGRSEKLPTVGSAKKFIAEMRDLAAVAARQTALPEGLSRENWPAYVRSVVSNIRRGR